MTNTTRSVMANLIKTAQRTDAPAHVMAWLWETAGADDQDQRLNEMERVLWESLYADDPAPEPEHLAEVLPLFARAAEDEAEAVSA